jgi:hypothetical protein
MVRVALNTLQRLTISGGVRIIRISIFGRFVLGTINKKAPLRVARLPPRDEGKFATGFLSTNTVAV